ncbi:MAG: hypothetical protein JWO66_46 [Candidatus Eremiobacteraeota bacterium]|nr:hypothetical protein [Candidatus Eremiobacteraeota bacterium]
MGFLAAAVVTASAVASATDAPADESFGPFKYTAISVRTKIDALARSHRERWSDNGSLLHDAGLVESSYRVWAQRYPKDRWLAPTAFHLAQFYQSIQSQDARTHASAMFEYVAKTFPNTKEAHLARLRLRQGFPPLHPDTPLSPTPNPYAPAASSAPSMSPSPTATMPSPMGSGAPPAIAPSPPASPTPKP